VQPVIDHPVQLTALRGERQAHGRGLSGVAHVDVVGAFESDVRTWIAAVRVVPVGGAAALSAG